MQKTLSTLGSVHVQGLWQHGRRASGSIDVGLVGAWPMESSFQSLVLKRLAQSLLLGISRQV